LELLERGEERRLEIAKARAQLVLYKTKKLFVYSLDSIVVMMA